MNENNITSAPPLWHLKLARVLFYILFAAIVIETIQTAADVFYFASQPASAVQVSISDSRYNFQGLSGYYRLSFDYLAIYGEITDGRLLALSIAAAKLLFRRFPLLLIMNLGRKLIKTLKSSYTPFTAETTSYIKKIGIIMICMGSLSRFLFQVSINIINLHRINYANPYDLSWILAGIFTFLLADIFARGCYLQQESDETL